MNKWLFSLLLIVIASTAGAAEAPDWTQKLPFTDDAFWGVGMANSQEEAEVLAKQEILMQMSSHVSAVVSMEITSGGGKQRATEDIDAYFSGNTLRGAELVETYSDGSSEWALMKYCDDCGKSLIKSALNRFEETYGINVEEAMEVLASDTVTKAFTVERRLEELQLSDYGTDDILVRFENKKVIIMIINFIPYQADLSPTQQEGLRALGESLLNELNDLDYRSIGITGHANPTGEAGEEEELIELSKVRAQTLSGYLNAAGLTISSVNWMGGNQPIGDISTASGKGRNRRVEILVDFE